MKNSIYFLLLTSYFSLSFAQGNYTFGPSIRVNDDPPGTVFHCIRSSGQRGIACFGDTVYIAWDDEREPLRSVYFSRNTDGGQTWSPNFRISQPGVSSGAAGLALDGLGRIYATWMTIDSNNNRDVYFAKSTDGGLTFSAPVLVNDTTRTVQQMPSIAVDSSGQKIYMH